MATWLPIPTGGARARESALTLGAMLALALMLGAGISVALLRFEVPLALVIAGCAGLLAFLALVVTRYDVAAAVGFLLMAVVNVEPAPPDVLFGVIISVALVTGRFHVAAVPRAALAAVGVFIVLNIVSTVDAVDGKRAALFFSITLYLCLFSIWLAGYLNSERRARTVVLCYVGAAVASALLGTLAILVQFPGADLFLGAGDTRAQALFEDPNVYGPFLVPPALILLEESIRPRLIHASVGWKRVLFMVIVLGVLFSYSRAAWLNLVVGTTVMLAVLSLRRGSGAGALRIVAVLSLAGAVAAATVVFTASAEFLQERAQLQVYDTERFGGQRLGVQFGEEHPVGIGPGQFEVRAPIAAHSTYIRVFAEQGAPGFAAFVALVLATLIFAVRNAVLGRDTYGIGSAALLGAWCGILANSLVVDTLHWRHLWVVAALVWVGALRR